MLLKNKYGLHQSIHLMPFAVDRTNLFVGRVEFHVDEDFDKPNSGYLSLSYGATIASLSGITGLASGKGSSTPLCVGIERRYDEQQSQAIYTYTFEGIATNHNIKYIDFEMEFTMNQEPIETHPSFAELDSLFGPYDALNRLWPRYITQATASVGLTGQQQAQQGAVTNPIYGVSSYLAPGAIYRISFTDTDVDSTFWDDVGAIVTPPKLGTAFPTFQNFVSHTNRNWLKMAPKIRQHGSCIAIIEEYMLSGPRGWDPNIYSPQALKGQTL